MAMRSLTRSIIFRFENEYLLRTILIVNDYKPVMEEQDLDPASSSLVGEEAKGQLDITV